MIKILKDWSSYISKWNKICTKLYQHFILVDVKFFDLKVIEVQSWDKPILLARDKIVIKTPRRGIGVTVMLCCN